MLEGEASCGTSLLDFSVLGSLTEKSSDLVQMSPQVPSQGGRAPVSYTHLDVYKRQYLLSDLAVFFRLGRVDFGFEFASM